MKWEKRVEFRPAYDKRNADPKKNYGIHGVEMVFVFIGPLGAVQFVTYTNWQLPHVREETDNRILFKARGGEMDHALKTLGRRMDTGELLLAVEKGKAGGLDQIDLNCFYHPMPSDLGYHSPRPMYEGQKPIGSEKFEWKEPDEEMKKAGFNCKMPVAIPTNTVTPCEYLDGQACYYEGSTLNAEPIFEVLLREGSEGVWRELQERYERQFSGAS